MYRIVLYILVLFLCVEPFTAIIDKNTNDEKHFKCVVEFGEICIDAKDGAYGAVLTVAVGLLTGIDAKVFHQAVDKVLVMYNQNPKTIATLGLFLSIAFLKDSIDDYGKIEMYDRLIKNALRDKDEDSRLDKLKDIKMLLMADRKRQITMGCIKGLFAAGFGTIAYHTTANYWLFGSMVGAATVSGAAALVNVYNYQQFSTLMSQLKQDGHID